MSFSGILYWISLLTHRVFQRILLESCWYWGLWNGFFLYLVFWIFMKLKREKEATTDQKITKINKTWRNEWKILSKSIAGTALSFCVKQLKADRPLLEPVMTRVSAPSKVSWGLHSTRYVQQQPTWSPGVAGRCPGPHASLRARQRHGLTPDLLLSSPGIQRTGLKYFRTGEFSVIFHQLKKF